jgi:hypothetical protein
MEGHDLDEVLATAIQLQALKTYRVQIAFEPLHDAQGYLETALQKHGDGTNLSQERKVEIAAVLTCRLDGSDNLEKLCFTWCEHQHFPDH